MADLLPDPPTPPNQPGRRDWHTYQDYRVVHESNLATLANEGVITVDDVLFVETRERFVLREVNLRGRIATVSGAILTVNKWLSVSTRRGRLCVLTREYDYHACVVVNDRMQSVFRYDNCHGGLDTLHRHPYDANGRDGTPVPVPIERMPTLSMVIREAEFYAAYFAGRTSD